MSRFASMSVLFSSVVFANHMNGSMQDRLDVCEKQECPGAFEYFEEMVTAGDLNVGQWISNLTYVQEDVSKMYPEMPGHIECVCQKCTALVEPIWQPVGRNACSAMADTTLPCQQELDACLAAGNTEEVCQPDKSTMGYKAAYDLSDPEECKSLCRNEDGENKPPCNTEDPLIKLQECLAASRTNAGDQSILVTLPCDKAATEKGTCEGVPATQCTPLPSCGWNDVPCCFYEGTQDACVPFTTGRRLLFGGVQAECVCE